MVAMRITPKPREHDALVDNGFTAKDVRQMFSVPDDYLILVNGAYVEDSYPLRDGDSIDWIPDPRSDRHKPMTYDEAFDRALDLMQDDNLEERDRAAMDYFYRVFGPKGEEE